MKTDPEATGVKRKITDNNSSCPKPGKGNIRDTAIPEQKDAAAVFRNRKIKYNAPTDIRRQVKQ
jgi:hypothetical protein